MTVEIPPLWLDDAHTIVETLPDMYEEIVCVEEHERFAEVYKIKFNNGEYFEFSLPSTIIKILYKNRRMERVEFIDR